MPALWNSQYPLGMVNLRALKFLNLHRRAAVDATRSGIWLVRTGTVSASGAKTGVVRGS